MLRALPTDWVSGRSQRRCRRPFPVASCFSNIKLNFCVFLLPSIYVVVAIKVLISLHGLGVCDKLVLSCASAT